MIISHYGFVCKVGFSNEKINKSQEKVIMRKKREEEKCFWYF